MNASSNNIASDAKVNAFDLGVKIVDKSCNAASAVTQGTKHAVHTTSDSVTGFFAGMKFAINQRRAPRTSTTSKYYAKRDAIERARAEREAEHAREMARKRAQYNYATGNTGTAIIILGSLETKKP